MFRRSQKKIHFRIVIKLKCSTPLRTPVDTRVLWVGSSTTQFSGLRRIVFTVQVRGKLARQRARQRAACCEQASNQFQNRRTEPKHGAHRGTTTFLQLMSPLSKSTLSASALACSTVPVPSCGRGLYRGSKCQHTRGVYTKTISLNCSAYLILEEVLVSPQYSKYFVLDRGKNT
jgi:hypothetical protein